MGKQVKITVPDALSFAQLPLARDADGVDAKTARNGH
jgi:hypothetical protein